MTMPLWTFRELLSDARVDGLAGDKNTEAIRACLAEHAPKGHELIPVHILAGIGAWFAAGFFLVFAGMGGLFKDDMPPLIVGMMLLGGGTVASRFDLQGVFVRQVTLAASLTGNALALVGLASMSGSEFSGALTIGQLVICAVFYPLNRSYAYRFLAPIGVCLFAVIWIFEHGQGTMQHGVREVQVAALHGLVAAETLLFGYLWLGKARPSVLQPLAYAAAVMLPATLLSVQVAQIEDWSGLIEVRLWPSSLILGAGLLWAIASIAGRGVVGRSPDLWLAVGGTVLLSLIAAPGILVAVGLLAVGRALGDRILLVLGYVFFPAFLFTYYYSLEIDLASKSWILAGSGLVLLVLHQVLRRMDAKEAGA
jgi:Domain of unknown function (DUF4401)